LGVETCSPEVVDYNKTVVFDCHLYVFIVISNTSGCLALNKKVSLVYQVKIIFKK